MTPPAVGLVVLGKALNQMSGEVRTISSHRRAMPWEAERDRAVLRLCFVEWERLPEPRPDLPTWLNGASTALLLLRQVPNA